MVEPDTAMVSSLTGETMISIAKMAGVACLVAGLAGCSSMTTISSTSTDAHLAPKHETPVVPSTLHMKDTSFGNYEFKANSPGHESFYGILPLRFHGGRLAADVLFFAPAAFFNLRGAFPYYEFDVDHGLVRYKANSDDSWHEY